MGRPPKFKAKIKTKPVQSLTKAVPPVSGETPVPKAPKLSTGLVQNVARKIALLQEADETAKSHRNPGLLSGNVDALPDGAVGVAADGLLFFATVDAGLAALENHVRTALETERETPIDFIESIAPDREAKRWTRNIFQPVRSGGNPIDINHPVPWDAE